MSMTNAVRQYRTAVKMSQTDCARLLGIPASLLSYIEGGMICTKEAREKCDLAYMCEENAEVMDDSECADFIVNTEAAKWDVYHDESEQEATPWI